MTFIVLYTASSRPLKFFERTPIPNLTVLPLAILVAGFLVFGNLSLELNDIGFYTMARLMACPTVVLVTFIFFNERISRLALLSVVALTGGVIIANGKFGLAHPLGMSVAITAFVVAAFYQVLIQKRLASLGVSSAQLLLRQAPLAVAFLLCLVPVFDTVPVVSK